MLDLLRFFEKSEFFGREGQFGFITAPAVANEVSSDGAGSISSLKLTPNLVSNEVNINVSLANPGNMDILLYDASGHLVKTVFSGRKEAGTTTQRLDTHSLCRGTYFVTAKVSGALIQSKLDVVKEAAEYSMKEEKRWCKHRIFLIVNKSTPSKKDVRFT